MFASMAKGSSDCSKVLGLKRFVIALLTLLEKKKRFCTFYSYIYDIFSTGRWQNYWPCKQVWTNKMVSLQGILLIVLFLYGLLKCISPPMCKTTGGCLLIQKHTGYIINNSLLIHCMSATRTSCCWSWDALEHVQFIRPRTGDYCAPFMIQCS